MDTFIEKFQKNKFLYLAFAIVILIGIFLRSYNFSSWLIVQGDQIRDFKITRNVISDNGTWPLLGPDLNDGRGFRLGPIYYHFQIISAKIFGLSLPHQAYPDWLFSILSIPLFYYFLTRYFEKRISLLVTGLYSCSFFMIVYSRFAWNINLVPFFSITFILAFWNFLFQRSKASWWWTIIFGASLGVGIQLHAILLVIFTIMSFGLFGFLLFKDPGIWKKIIVIISIVFFLNLSWLINEYRTNFSNTKNLFQTTNSKVPKEFARLLRDVKLDILCNAQANMHILSSRGNNKVCDIVPYDGSKRINRAINESKENPLSLAEKIVAVLFLVFGLWILIKSFREEKYFPRKSLLGTILIYETLFFLVMYFQSPEFLFRYFLAITVIPFLFLAFLFSLIMKKYPKKGIFIVVIIFLALCLANFNSIKIIVEQLLQRNKINII